MISVTHRAIRAVALSMLLSLCFSAGADTVQLKNGDLLSGNALAIEAGHLVFQTTYAGRIEIGLEHIENLETTNELMLLRDGKPPLTGRISIVDGALVLTHEARVVPFAANEFTYLGPPLPSEPRAEVAWSGNLDLAFTLRRGDTDTTAARTSLGMERTKRRRTLNRLDNVSVLQLKLSGAYGEANKVVNTERADFFEEYRRYLRERLYLLQLAGFEHDIRRGLDFRSTTGLGVGYDLVSTDQRDLSLNAAITYDYEEWEDEGGTQYETHIVLRMGLGYEERFGHGVVFNDDLLLMPVLDDPGQYRLSNRLALTAPIGKSVHLRMEWRTEYDSDPGSDVEKLDNIFTTGVRYTF